MKPDLQSPVLISAVIRYSPLAMSSGISTRNVFHRGQNFNSSFMRIQSLLEEIEFRGGLT